MGIYSNKIASNSRVVTVEAQLYPEDMTIMETALTAVIESQDNWNALMTAVGCHELNVLESTGCEIVYEGANLHDFFAAVKTFFIKVIKKIKGIFEQFIAKIESFLRSDKDFVKKYETKIAMGKANLPSSFSMKGYKFEGVTTYAAKLDSVYNANLPTENDIVNLSADDKVKHINELRGDMIKSGYGELESKDFSKEFKDFLYGDKEELDDAYVKANLATMISDIKDAADVKKKAKDQLDKTVTAVNKFIKKMDELEKATGKEISADRSNDENTASVDKIAAAKCEAEIAKSICEVYTTANGMFLSALKSRTRQSKAICVKVISYAGKEVKNESYSYQTEGVVFQ